MKIYSIAFMALCCVASGLYGMETVKQSESLRCWSNPEIDHVKKSCSGLENDRDTDHFYGQCSGMISLANGEKESIDDELSVSSNDSDSEPSEEDVVFFVDNSVHVQQMHQPIAVLCSNSVMDPLSLEIQLLRAAVSDDLPAVKMAVCAGADTEFKDPATEHNALLTAIYAGNDATVQFLIQCQCVNLNAKDMYGRYAILAAAHKGYFTYVEWLMDAGASWAVVDPESEDTLLHIMVKQKHKHALPFIEQIIGNYPEICSQLKTENIFFEKPSEYGDKRTQIRIRELWAQYHREQSAAVVVCDES